MALDFFDREIRPGQTLVYAALVGRSAEPDAKSQQQTTRQEQQ